MCQKKTFNPVFHVLQHPAVSEFISRCLHSQPIQTLRWVVFNDLKEWKNQKEYINFDNIY